jgi:hypothetical protein
MNNFDLKNNILLVFIEIMMVLLYMGCGNKNQASAQVNNPRATTQGLIEIWAKIGNDYNSDPGELPVTIETVKFPFLKVPRVNEGVNGTIKDNTGICCHVGSGSAEVNSDLPLYPPVVPYQCNAVITKDSKELGTEGANCGGYYTGGVIKIAMINLTDNASVINGRLDLKLLTSHVVAHEAGHGFLNNGGDDGQAHTVDNPATPNNEAEGWIMATSIALNEDFMVSGKVPVFTRCQINTIRQRLGLPSEIPPSTP